MFRQTSTNLLASGPGGGLALWLGHMMYPQMYKDQLALNQTHKVERALRLRTALKANKVDLRSLLALPVQDHAHPYKQEYPWEKCVLQDDRTLSSYGKFYKLKTMALYEVILFHKFGVMVDDMASTRGWFARAARTRAPKVQIIHGDRRVMRGRVMKDKYVYEPKKKWVQPVDNTAYITPYLAMCADEWEEKWGFFAGQTVEY